MTNAKKVTKTLDSKTQAELDKLDTTSAKIRFLLASGMSRGDTARILGKRYQHVRNVELQPLKNA